MLYYRGYWMGLKRDVLVDLRQSVNTVALTSVWQNLTKSVESRTLCEDRGWGKLWLSIQTLLFMDRLYTAKVL